MLEALHKMEYRGQVFIAGELDENDEYLKRLRKLSQGLNVHFLGFVNPLQALLALVQKAALFVFPSEIEGMSIMLLEVASVGRPIVASDIPENQQVFSSREVLYFKSKDSVDLAQKISFALVHPKEIEKLGNSCQEKVYSDYLWSNIASLYERLYLDLCS